MCVLPSGNDFLEHIKGRAPIERVRTFCDDFLVERAQAVRNYRKQPGGRSVRNSQGPLREAKTLCALAFQRIKTPSSDPFPSVHQRQGRIPRRSAVGDAEQAERAKANVTLLQSAHDAGLGFFPNDHAPLAFAVPRLLDFSASALPRNLNLRAGPTRGRTRVRGLDVVLVAVTARGRARCCATPFVIAIRFSIGVARIDLFV